MKKASRLSILFTLPLALLSCESLVDDLNVDPNNPAGASPSLMLTGAQVADVLVHEGELARRAGMWSGYFNGIFLQYLNYQQYNVNAGDFSGPWADVYTGVIKNTRIIQREAGALNDRRLVGIAKIVEAHAAGTATALWGDIPFAQVYDPQSPNPAYDAQADVYAALQNQLSSAIEDLSSGAGLPLGNADIFFSGDEDKWTEVAHTLKARYYLHTRAYEQAYQEARQGISDTSASLLAPHGQILGANRNVYYQFLVDERPAYLSAQGAYLPALLDPDSDNYRGNAKTDETARFRYFYITDQQDRGKVRNELEPNYLSELVNRKPNGYFSLDNSFPLVTYEENLLILAEAGARTAGLATGLEHLNTLREFMAEGGSINPEYLPEGELEYPSRYEPYTEEDFAPGGIENAGGLTPQQALLKEVLEERYVTFYGQLEGFNDLKRTAAETPVRVGVPPNAGGQLPARFLYPQTEIDNNRSTPQPIPGLFEPTSVNQ